MAKKKKQKKGKRKKHKGAGPPSRRLDKGMSNVGTGSAKKSAKTQKAKATRARRKPEGPVLTSLSDVYQYFRENTEPDLLHLTDVLQPARHRRVDRVVQVHHLLRQLPRWALALVLAGAHRPPRLRVLRVSQLLPAGQQGGHRLHQEERSRQGTLRHVRRGDRGLRTPARSRDRTSAARAARRDRLEDRHDPARQRGRGGQRPERHGQGEHLQAAAQARQVSRSWQGPCCADAVRRLRSHDVLHLERGRLPRERGRTRPTPSSRS